MHPVKGKEKNIVFLLGQVACDFMHTDCLTLPALRVFPQLLLFIMPRAELQSQGVCLFVCQLQVFNVAR